MKSFSSQFIIKHLLYAWHCAGIQQDTVSQVVAGNRHAEKKEIKYHVRYDQCMSDTVET